ncbi:RNA 2',3'-cyclic phosphodiesterase [Roseisalinus antarcticus]|uniref:RNA 2',3'-cyclic phosphodiesterase n=1 Tax=Roseisalinus antarcticus TaxID=254357 RepID=A0A1Y5RFC6_9RHOB|nr:RNA 2',3'-cyclic phosphodiesterase [Roseisalinus antarcticus]SLN16310.1 2',5' RNA ligase family [Roseisalinus antarcticus]
MRAFVAIDLPDDAAPVLERLQVRMPIGRAVDPETFHITLAFLGDVPAGPLEELDAELSLLVAAPFEITIAGLTTFGGHTPAVMAAEIVPTQALTDLQARIASAARLAGIALERRRFRPHVTLARFRGDVTGDRLERLRRFLESEARFRLDPFLATQVVLYGSTLTRSGPIHEDLASYALLP